MPMAGEQLERSILERKERDELHAIASAMALKPPSRSRKADIIDLILTATGVGPDSGSAPGGAAPDHANGDHANGDHANGAGRIAALADQASDAGEPEPAARPRRAPRAGSRRAAAESPDVAPTLFEGEAGPSASTGASGSAELAGSAADVPMEGPGAAAGSGVDDVHLDGGEQEHFDSAGSRNGSSAREHVAVPASAGGTRDEVREVPVAAGEGGGALDGSRPREPRPRVPVRDRPERAQHAAHQVPASSQPQAQAVGAAPSAYSTDAGNRRGRRRRGRERERGDVQAPQESAWQGELVPVKGLLDLREEGYGFLRTSGYLASSRDVYVSVNQARKFALRKGDAIEGACRPAGPSEKYPALLRIDSVGGLTPDEARQRPRFEDLTPLFPDSTLRLEQQGEPSNLTARIVDLISPIGKGQRGMIVSPPKAGKTTIMKQIAHSIEANNPDVHLIVLLVDERPEEVTDIRRSVRGEVIASTFDRPADEHTAVAELTIERAKRLVEVGRDVVIILDGITRLARAYNLAQPATGRIMSGGVDSGALYPPKRFFGAARNVEEGGSLTILASALVETGSKMDEVIFEEFKGTGNMELRLDRKLAERRLYPAIDVNASSTRHEELLFDRSQLQQVWKLRRVLNALSNEGSGAAGLELLIDKIRTTRSNDEFLAEIAKAPVTTA
jgi:transcription termination factor Rho